ncbi:YidB family protein [Neisseria yangbaofengii]|uniref:YidB family protein n=1 Tax=Neisseria yangbaofengii TaxID=2709396 RepID=UPI0013ED61B6|nr:YidB family protein [Neisseria yangbaofengii]
MALMDTLLNAATQALNNNNNGTGQNPLIDMAMDLVRQQGGTGNLINQLQQGGLGDALGSWISTSQDNAPVSGNALQSALGSDVIGQVAQKFGMDGQQVSDLLAQVLPSLVDSVTPNGNPQEADGFGLDDIASLVLKNFIK